MIRKKVRLIRKQIYKSAFYSTLILLADDAECALVNAMMTHAFAPRNARLAPHNSKNTPNPRNSSE